MSYSQNQWQSFLLEEGVDEKTIFTFIQGLQEVLSNLKPRSISEERRLQLAKQHLKEIRRSARRMQNEVSVLQEKLSILEETLNENEVK